MQFVNKNTKNCGAGKADHAEPPVLYSIIMAQPSERKSSVMHFVK